ncbi:fused response regulator/phosphatase [Anoxynatronum sibiricum]|uniref:Stage 0 sporulation protein A homolog n=1 Tax=Anoxynatronum sibiricum TaxID=210623 RepID=A0ABU9VQA1_9CLOT
MYNILIVDDMLVNRKLMKKVLSDTIADICFVDAEDGFQALESLDKQEIDLVILDLMMPGKDGYEVLAEMKKDQRHQDIPVIVNSAVTDMESIKKTLELGAMDYFTKPITPEQMKVIIPLKANNALKFYEQRKKLKEINLRMKNELKIASMLQRSLIRSKDEHQRVKVYQKYLACDELGGDLFDYIETPDKDWFMIADITGHGVAASLVASMLKVVFNHAIQANDDPASVLQEINLTFYHLMSDSANLCFSVFVGCISGDIIRYSNAGHPYPVLIRKNTDDWQMLEVNGYLIGLFDDATYINQECLWHPGEAILTYTDGLFENPRNPEKSKSYLSVFQHAKLLDNRALNNPELFMEQLMASFGKADKNQIDDDIAIMYMVRHNHE